MQDLIKAVVQNEQDAERLVRDARAQAAALLGAVDADGAARLQALRQAERDKTADAVAQAEAACARRRREAEETSRRRREAEGQAAPPWVEDLTAQVAARLMRTVFDR